MEQTKVSIKHLRNYAGRGWAWTVITKYAYLDEPIIEDWSTNEGGDGLWLGEHQILGTCQFHLSDSRPSAYSKIRRYFMEDAPGYD